MKHSLLWCEARLPRGDVLAAHQTRLRLQTFARLSSRYLDELDHLMSDTNPVIRARALEAFRKTVGLEGNGGVHVNVNAAGTARTESPRSFEEILDVVKGKMSEGSSNKSLLKNCPED